MLRAGPVAPLARGRPLPVLRSCQRRLRRPGRRPAAPAALPLCGVWRPLRRPDRHRPGRPLRLWVLCLYLMGLNLSNRQIARELDLGVSDVQAMTEALRQGLTAKLPPVVLQGEVEIDEVYVVAGHKGNPAAVAKRGARGAVGA